MRVLMVSKACVVGIYQRKLEEIARLGVDLLVVSRRCGTIQRRSRAGARLPEGYRLVVEPLRFNGNFHLHYSPALGRHIRDFRPDIVHIDEEPYNLATWHALWLAAGPGRAPCFLAGRIFPAATRRRFPGRSLDAANSRTTRSWAHTAPRKSGRRKAITGRWRSSRSLASIPSVFQPAESPPPPHAGDRATSGGWCRKRASTC